MKRIAADLSLPGARVLKLLGAFLTTHGRDQFSYFEDRFATAWQSLERLGPLQIEFNKKW